jgi:hypothetical protein
VGEGNEEVDDQRKKLALWGKPRRKPPHSIPNDPFQPIKRRKGISWNVEFFAARI